MTILVVAEAAVIVLLAILVVGMLRSHAEILRKLHEMGAGESTGEAPFRTADGISEPSGAAGTAHDVTGTTPDGGSVALRVKDAPHATLLAFMSTTCPTCELLWPAFEDPGAVAKLGAIRFVIVTKSPADESPARVAELAPAGTTLVMSSRAWEDYEIPGSPYFVMVGANSTTTVGEGSAGTWDKLLDLMGIADSDAATVPHRHDADRAERIDRELADAGILPGDPQLYGEHGGPMEAEH